MTISGNVAPGFEQVATAFEAAFEGRPDMGAGLHIRRNGEVVADLWDGVADRRAGAPWTADTAAVVFSCTKGLVSLLAAQLVQEGQLDYDAPVARYWPEFAQAGKDSVTLGQALAHQAGLSALDVSLTADELVDWERVTAALAAMTPLWPPGTGYTYHPITHGWLAGEVIRRVTGKSVGQVFAERVAKPIGADAWIGLPRDHAGPVAHSVVAEPLIQLWADEAAREAAAPPNWAYRAMTLGEALPAELVTDTGGFNDRRIQQAEIPGAGGIASARGLAAIWSAAVTPTEGGALLDAATRERATRTMSEGRPVFPAEPPFSRWGMGFQLDSESRRYLGPNSFGHDGAGGQSAFADPDHGVGFAFVTNWMEGPGDERATAIIDALRRSIS
jgi:CubicO group peptidase (beta-lactamase class C family)